VQRHLLAQQVLPLLVQVVALEQQAGEVQLMLALSIQPGYQVGCECSHRVEQLQHQSLLELALPSLPLPFSQGPSLPQGQRPLQVSYLGTSPSTFAQRVLQQLMMLT
jgi:hypothetical protein